MNTIATPRRSFKEHIHQAREEAILQTTCQLLGAKGFDTMTMDDLAQGVGIAKASLYKHFNSKADLCFAAMVQVLERVRAYVGSLDTVAAPADQLRSVVRWSLERLLAQEMPLLPSRNSALRAVLMSDPGYIDGLVRVSDQIGQWITQAQAEGSIDPALPPLVVLYTLYARACDPVPEFLQASGLYTDAQILELMLRTCFNGMAAPRK